MQPAIPVIPVVFLSPPLAPAFSAQKNLKLLGKEMQKLRESRESREGQNAPGSRLCDADEGDVSTKDEVLR